MVTYRWNASFEWVLKIGGFLCSTTIKNTEYYVDFYEVLQWF